MELLIVGTLDGQIGAASKIAIAQGGHVSLADKIESALEILRSGKTVELVMIDVRLDVHKFISSLEAERINVLVVAAGVSNDPALAVNAIKAGAREYIPLPPDPELIGAVLAAATRENHALIYGDKKTEQVLKLAKQIAPSEANVLLTGESGTGKEIFSRFIHDNSKRANKNLSRSTAPPYRKRCWNPNFSAMKKARLPVRLPVVSASLKKLPAARCCLMKFPKWTFAFKPSCCAPFRRRKSTVSAAKRR